MASIPAPRPSLAAFARRARVFLLAFPVGAALVLVAWPRPRLASVETPPGPGGSESSLADAIARARMSTVALEYEGGDAEARRVASGVVVDDRGGVLSVKIDAPSGAAKIWALDAAGHRHRAEWLAADPETGLTLLRVEAADILPIRPASRRATLGEEVFLIGNPYGLGHSVGRGYVAGLGRRLDIDPRPLGDLIQVQVPIHPGDSGALLADLRGEWLGLVRSGLATPDTRGLRDHDLGFAIPADEALWVARQLRARGRVDRAYLGIFLGADSHDEPGAAVARLEADSPAARAGLLPKDRVVGLGGHEIRTGGDLVDRLDRLAAGTSVALDYTRGPASGRVTARLASRPAAKAGSGPAAPPSSPGPERPVDPRELLDHIERLERRLQDLERRDKATAAPEAGRPGA